MLNAKPPKHIRHALAQWRGIAYERELTKELWRLSEYFKKLDRGELSPFDVSDAIHLFHNGVCRELYIQYIMSGIDDESLVSSAVVRGTIAREELPAELSEFLEEQINLIQKR